MSSQQNESPSQSNGGGGSEMAANAEGSSQSTQPEAEQRHPQQNGPQDLFGLLANVVPQAMEGIVNSILSGGGVRQGQRPADDGLPNDHTQPVPPVIAGLDRLVDVLRQQQQLWEGMGERIDRIPEERRRMAEESRQNNDPQRNILSQLEEALHRWQTQPQPATAARPAPTAAPINFMEQLTAAAAGLAGMGTAAGQGQSFMERLQAAAGAAQPGAANQQPPPGTAPPLGGDQRHRQVFDLPQFGGARIEIVGFPGNLDEMILQLRQGFDPNASSGSRIPDEHLARLPNSSVKQKHVDDGKQCFICMDQYTEVGERVAEMTCGHIFHTNCIVPWLKRNTTCPVCRAEVVSRNWIFDEIELD
ncbi:hypothetical protein PMAYCL1PPCAC_24284 [Pristionchus mayeri]|uniref:RING-type domain-containing protein n=1 Tax=Pristionchus mayeri TaxID=1317129 RepID=A0AAN5I784_9BILA|nr:hypothetical protein PMAYCL1PPCAC_24284 [Pristionchus mayeri]